MTDSLFSMDGDLAPLAQLAALAQRYDAMLLVDEAHATGVFGAHGRGVLEHQNVIWEGIICIGTLSKALGCSGGFVAGSRALVDWLTNRARPYVFSTAFPAANAAAALAALDIIDQEPHRGADLLTRANPCDCPSKTKAGTSAPAPVTSSPSSSASPTAALSLSAQLRERGIWLPAIRPPSVPAGKSLLRLSLSWRHTPSMLADLLAELKAHR